MKIKRYEASTEKEAMLKVKEDLGREALIVSVKNIKPRGLYKIFKKPYVEITAALDDNTAKTSTYVKPQELVVPSKNPQANMGEEGFLEIFRSLAGVKDPGAAPKQGVKAEPVPENTKSPVQEMEITEASEAAPTMKIIYDQLLANEVDELYVNELTRGLGEITHGPELDSLVSIIYKRIVKGLADVETIKLNSDKAKIVAFIGPTGVGKTTTIAKIASYFSLNLEKKVALITADTYRIAAVEQLRTYANILGIPIKVVYSPDDLKHAIESFSQMDLILIDTAGRSHKNEEHHSELVYLLDSIDEKEIYLVLSLATKYNDLIHITDAYNDIGDYKLIFTKLDETSSFGNILNMKYKTNAKLSYVTFGQNVPDDISEANVHEIAKKILGGCE